MKTTPTATLNSINFQNFAQKALYAAHVLKQALSPSPQITITPAVTAVVGKRNRVGYPAVPAVAAMTAARNTAGKAIGEVRASRPGYAAVPASDGYAAAPAIAPIIASPAYPAGTAIPAYPAIAAIPAQAEVLPVAAAQAVVAPAVVPLVGYSDAVMIDELANGVCQITAYFPVATAPAMVGSSIQKISEITPTALTVNGWVGQKCGGVSFSSDVGSLPPTLEECFFAWAQASIDAGLDAGSITTENHTLGGINRACKKVVLKVQRDNNYAPSITADPQLATVTYYNSGSGGNGGGGTQSI
jgi:hypothetical protein